MPRRAGRRSPVRADPWCQSSIRQRFQGLDGYALADNVSVYAAVLNGEAGVIGVTAAALLLDCSIATPLGHQSTAKLALIGPPEGMRKIGRLLRDSANAAANRAERPR